MKLRYLWISIICFLIMRPILFLFIPLVEPSEARYADVAKRMISTGDFMTPYTWKHGKQIPYMSKPAFGFYFIAAGIKLFGVNRFAPRIFLYTISIALLVITFFILRRYNGLYIAVASTAICAASAGFYFICAAVLVDVVLMFFAVSAVVFYHAFLSEGDIKTKKVYSLLIFTSLAFAFLAKGPVALIYFGIPVFFHTIINNKWKELQYHSWIPGGTIFIFVTFPWFISEELKHPGYLNYFFIHENLLRLVKHDYGDLYGHGHIFPRGTALGFALLSFMPWILIPLINILIIVFVKTTKKDMILSGKPDSSVYKLLSPAICSGSLKRGKEKSSLIKTLSFLRECFFKTNPFRNIFFCGFVFLILFFCVTKQIQLYYIAVISPFFAAWLAEFMKSHKLPLKIILYCCIIFFIIYTIAWIPVTERISTHKSPEKIVIKGYELAVKNPCAPGKMFFAHRSPFTAYFYAEDLIADTYGKTGPEIYKIISARNNPNDVFIIEKEDWRVLSPQIKKHFRPVLSTNKWILLKLFCIRKKFSN